MCENTLTLRFEGTKRLELVSSEFFSSATKETLMAIRGKSSGAYIRYGCFQWTSGVRAVCAAFIRFALSERNDRVDFCLIGAKGSLAASLDYAISKGPAWLGEMFGSTSGGAPYAKRLFRVSNPNRKRPGPVALSVNRNLIATDGLKLIWNGREVSEIGELHTMLTAIEDQSSDECEQGEIRNIVNF